MITLNGAGSDFSLSVTSLSTVTVSPGGSATYSIAAVPTGGFDQTIALTCSGAPALSTCAISPSSLQLKGTSSATATVSITTTGPSMSVADHLGPPRKIFAPLLTLLGLTMFALSIVVLFRRDSEPLLTTPVGLTTLLWLAIFLCSCGGSSSSSSNGAPGIMAGTYTLTITGNAGSAAATHQTTLSLIVH